MSGEGKNTMKRMLTVLLAVGMLVGMTAPAVALASDASQATDDVFAAQATTTGNATVANETPPGAMLAGSIGVHEAEMNGAIEQRSFNLQIRDAGTNDSMAQVLNRTQDRLQDRQRALEERKDRLEDGRENDTITESRYRAQMSVVAAESVQIETMANETERNAEGLPAETLEANDVNVTAIQQVRERAHSMRGPEVAEMARQIAGNNVGTPMGPPENIPGHQAGQHGGMDNASAGPGQQSGMNATSAGGDGPAAGNGQGEMTTNETNETEPTEELARIASGPGA
ncbi:hypothetical protein HLASF_0145 [Halanaeroarchaeum sulfurireducens]|uniref:Uncharacterized protein n=2 Tax=Halanaeroarchaeum sulfurireducens TaxID=1604004 RepID=A0A0F7PAL4_9EURY|nr:hypothetical protein HLASF_0145 [Halanaeroarchaeum sulfurireducens]ALG81061.1 hypothetical protein HLASA_0145 [Halanaeroarchaeum sulfurireducens]